VIWAGLQLRIQHSAGKAVGLGQKAGNKKEKMERVVRRASFTHLVLMGIGPSKGPKENGDRP